jgi:hypothetical protein
MQAAVGGVGYGWYRLQRRFRKTAIGLAVTGAAVLGSAAYFAVYADHVRYGSNIRAALARPRVMSTVATFAK